jgi:hypothetical protein
VTTPRPARPTDRGIRSVVLAGAPRAADAVPICTIVRAPSGGWTAILHPSDCEPPAPSPQAVTFPDIAAATRFARTQYPSLYVEVAPEDQAVDQTVDQTADQEVDQALHQAADQPTAEPFERAS